MIRAFHARRARPKRGVFVALRILFATASALATLALWRGSADAAAGSGGASILPPNSVVAGKTGTWTITYVAAENFAPHPTGGLIEIRVPNGWTPPQLVDSTAAGWVKPANATFIASITTSGQAIRLTLGTPSNQFTTGSAVSVIYGRGGGPASARADTVAPATAVFTVLSDPQNLGALQPIASSPSVSVVPDVVTHVRIVNAALQVVGDLARTTDQDTTHFYLRGYDKYENSARFVGGSWGMTSAVGSVAPTTGVGTVLTLTNLGSGIATADSGAWSDSTGAITVVHGAFARLALSVSPTATAGSPFAAAVEALDADDNRITSGPGSSISIRFVAYADSLGPTPADPDLTNEFASLSFGFWSGNRTARRSGLFFLAAKDTVSGIESSPRRRLLIDPAPADVAVLVPDPLALTAGEPESMTVYAVDLFGNRAPVTAAETLVLWTDRPQGTFTDFAGTEIFDITIPAGADSVRFRFTDSQATTTPGQVRVIDASGVPPYLDTVPVSVTTSPNVPSGAVLLSAAADTLTANGVDSTTVTSGVVRDAYGNSVGAGRRFTVTASALTILTDDDAGASGVQWITASNGMLSGRVRAGFVKGAASVSVTSEQGSATGGKALTLVAGPPAGTIALVATPDSLAADSVSVRAVTAMALVDGNGNGVENGERYTVATTLGSIATADADPGLPGVQVSASGGAISFGLFGGDSLGVANVTATSVRGTSTGNVAVRLVPGNVDSIRSSVTAVSPVPAGAPGSTATVALRDAQGHPIAFFPSDSVDVSAIGVPVSITPLAGATDASGALAYTVVSTVTGSATLSAEIPSRAITLADQPTIVFEPAALDHYVVSGPASPLTAGVSESLTVEARDAFGNAMPSRSGDVLRPVATAGAASLPDSVTLVNGTATVVFLPTLAAPLTINVPDDSSHAVAYGPVTVNPGAAWRAVAGPPAVPTLSTGDSTAVLVTLLDAFGNTISGGTLASAVVLGGGSTSPSSATTDNAGRATFTLRAGMSPGTVVTRLFAPGSAAADSIAADTVAIAVVPGTATSVTIAAAGGTVVAGAPLDVTLTLRDAFGNLASGATPSIWLRTTSGLPDSISWSLGAGASGALADSASGDGALYAFAAADSGIATLRVRGTRAETLRLRASGAGLPLDESGDVTVLPAAPATLAIQGGNGQTAVVAGLLANPLRVTARDAFGNVTPGAAVAFRVTSGNGSVDAIAGGAVDSVATANAFGIATCEVARVGTAAGVSNNAYRAGLVLAPSAEVFFTASATPDVAVSLALAPGSFSLPAGQTATVTATAADVHGNPVPGTNVTLYLDTPIAGSLESLGGTSGSGASQAGATDAAGEIAVRYRAPNSAPAADSIFARGTSIAPVGIRATVGTSAIASLRILPDATVWTAGVPARVRVQALDGLGNVAVADTGTVIVGATDPVSFAPAFGSLAGGEFETFATATLADTLTLTAALAATALSDSAGPIAVVPAAPAGAIAATAARTELTADGRSSAGISFGPVRDAFGNVVATGTLLTVTAAAGSLLAADASPAPGLQVATAADDTARVLLVAPTAAGPDTIRAVAGSATGAIAFAYLAPPSIAYGPGSLAPGVVAPGQSAAFRLLVQNTGAVGSITIGATSSLGFGAGAGAFAASPVAPLTLGAGASDTLRFLAAAISTSLSPGSYAPSLRLTGTDATGEPFDFFVGLAGAQVHVAGVTVAAVGAVPNPAPLGASSLVLTFDVTNLAGTAAQIDGTALQTSAGGFTVNGVSPPLSASLPAFGTTTLALSVTVPSSGITPGTIVQSRLVASVAYGAVSVSAQNAATLDFQVVSAAQITAVAAGTTPARYLRFRTFGPTARVANNGAATVTLDRTATRLVLERGPADSLVAPLTADAVVNGSGTADLAFDSLAVASATKGRYAAWLVLRGFESGQPFAATIPLAPDSVDVVDPALLAVTGTVAPAVLSAGQSRSLSVTVTNSGDVPFVLEATTALALAAPISTVLAVAAPDTIPALGARTVVFAPAAIGSPLAPGTAAATLEARGTEDGRFRAEALPAGTMTASPPASLAFVAGSATPDTLRAGQSYTIAATIRNNGGSSFTVDPTSTRLVITDGVESVVALASGAPFALAPAAQGSLPFASAAVPAALASQSYPVTLVIHGTEWGQAESLTVVSPPGEISVVEPVAAVQVQGLDPGAPVQASAEDGAFRIWTLELQPLVPIGGAASARLTAVALTVLSGGAPAANPSSVIADITLRDALGTLLAQATPGASNPVTLTLGATVALNGPPVPIHVEVTLRPGAGVSSVALRVASDTDVSVQDDVSGLPVAIRAVGGLPFAPLTSPSVTLFAKAHGYPNPFRAGRESVRLSYRLSADAGVRVSIYTLLGDLVRELSLGSGQAGGSRGLNEVPWDGRNGKGDMVRPGVYVAVIEGGGVSERIKVGVLR